ncbi:MAG: transglycosylase SLT domain-containing protein [Nocardioidaceae bacterium]
MTRVARYHGVRPPFALAIAWQESGWQQDEISSARAIGIMQVLPSTGRWLSQLVGFHLDIWHTRGNVRAGVIYLRFLEDHTPHHRRAIAGYYQGLASVRAHGMYHSTRRYVASVRALERSFRAGHYPL